MRLRVRAKQGASLGALLLLALPAWAGTLRGRVTDGLRGLAGARVYPDRTRHLNPLPPPLAVTDAEGRFHLELEAGDSVLCVEKEGWQRDLVPEADWGRDIPLRPAPEFRVEKVLVVCLDFPDATGQLPDAQLRRLLFSREPGASSAANYLYEVSKGSLVLEEGQWRHLLDSNHPAPRTEEQEGAMADSVILALKDDAFGDLDRVDNATGALKPDGKPDHLWIFVPGRPKSVTADKADLLALSMERPLPWDATRSWDAILMTESVPLGNIVHEAFHEMGEHHVDDLYLGCDDPLTAGIWDLMDAGQYRGWDRSHQDKGPWQEDMGYSPSHPGAWVRQELWYWGRFKDTVKSLRLALPRHRKKSDPPYEWEGWIAPLVRAPGEDAQRIVVADPGVRGAFWNFEVRRPWGFDRGRMGGRFGPGYEGLIVSHVDPDLLSDGEPQGPERVLDAHPGTKEPPPPRLPCGRWELDDAAYNVGPGENPKGRDGRLRFEVLEADAAGRMKVRIQLK